MRYNEFTGVTSGAREMALAVEIQLPVNVLTQNQTSLTLLIQRAASGDTVAFEQLMIYSEQRVMAMSWRMLGNDADARDATQEVFLRVYKYLGRFRQDQDFFAWLYRITVNVCRDIQKKPHRKHDSLTSLDDDPEQSSLAVRVESGDAEETLIQSQQRELIVKAMSSLSNKERAAIVLRDLEGLSTGEVARILKSSSTTVRSQISSGRRKIKFYCEQYLQRKGKSS